MYCPNCATQNSDDGKFCRGCGANLSLVPQALTGQLPDSRRHKRRHREFERNRRPDPAHGVSKIISGLGFVMAALGVLIFFPGGRFWWFWMLIPAFLTMGKGVAEIVAAKQMSGATPQLPDTNTQQRQVAPPPQRNTNDLQPYASSGITAPPSVTESTTRLFDEADQSK